jgi:hypothetical protein
MEKSGRLARPYPITSREKPAQSSRLSHRDNEKTDYFLSAAPLSSLLVSFFDFAFDFFFILFIELIDPLSVAAGLVALGWLFAGAPAVCADAVTTADKPITAAQTDVSMVFRMEASCCNNPCKIANPPAGSIFSLLTAS